MSINDANGNLHSDTDGRFTEKTGTRPGGSLAGPAAEPGTVASRAARRDAAVVTGEHLVLSPSGRRLPYMGSGDVPAATGASPDQKTVWAELQSEFFQNHFTATPRWRTGVC